MGFFDLKAKCAICEKDVGLNRYQLEKDVWMCPACFKDAGGMKNYLKLKSMSIEQIKELIREREQKLEKFHITKRIGTYFCVDEINKQWMIPIGTISGNIKDATIYNYNDIVSFELIEDGSSISKGGIGKAIAGGILFGGAGAIVGGVTGKKKIKNVCSKLQIKITVNDTEKPVEYINLINIETKKDGFVYKTAYSTAQEILSILEIICNENKNENEEQQQSEIKSVADEILKFKNLLDCGAITQEEFDKKKKELLNS